MQFQQAQCALYPETLFCKAIASSQTMLYKTMESKGCAQVSVSADYEKYVEEFAGFSQGNCADQGYKHADGTKSETFPIVGTVTVALYDNILKADETVTLYELAQNLCGQAVIDKKYEKYAEDFASLKEGTCADQGFTVADGEKDIKVPIIGEIKIALFDKPKVEDVAMVSLYQVELGVCAEAQVPKLSEGLIEKVDSGLTEGTCAKAGYTQVDGEKDVKIPFIGDIKFALYQKAPAVEDVAMVSLYQVEYGVCAEASVPKVSEGLIEKVDSGLTEGTCAKAGYTQVDGEKDVKIPFIGDIKFALYQKAPNTLQMMI